LGRGLLNQRGCGESGGSRTRVIDSRLVPVLCLRANRRVQVPAWRRVRASREIVIPRYKLEGDTGETYGAAKYYPVTHI